MRMSSAFPPAESHEATDDTRAVLCGRAGNPPQLESNVMPPDWTIGWLYESLYAGNSKSIGAF
jgi:hypothetical protein